MKSIRQHIWLAETAETVWALVGDPAAIAQWAPGIQSCTIDGSSRVLVLKRGGNVTEEIVTVDAVLRRLQYEVRRGLPFTAHCATVDVIEAGVNGSLVIYSTDLEPETAAPAVGAAIAGSLKILAQLFGCIEGR